MQVTIRPDNGKLAFVPTDSDVAWPDLILNQLDFIWARQARPRLEGLDDEEYLWEPVPDCWSLRAVGTGEHAGTMIMDSVRDDESAPDPVTTIAWRMAHVIVHILKARSYRIFNYAGSNPDDHVFAETAATALAQLDNAYLRWKTGVAALTYQDLAKPIGPDERYFEGQPTAALILHVNREVLSHIAEIALLRDLYLRHANA